MVLLRQFLWFHGYWIMTRVAWDSGVDIEVFGGVLWIAFLGHVAKTVGGLCSASCCDFHRLLEKT